MPSFSSKLLLPPTSSKSIQLARPRSFCRHQLVNTSVSLPTSKYLHKHFPFPPSPPTLTFSIPITNPDDSDLDIAATHTFSLPRSLFDLQASCRSFCRCRSPPSLSNLPPASKLLSPMYRGGKICLTMHFKPLWAKNSPKFGIAHALCLGLAPWLAAEIPILVDSGVVKHKDEEASPLPSSSLWYYHR